MNMEFIDGIVGKPRESSPSQILMATEVMLHMFGTDSSEMLSLSNY